GGGPGDLPLYPTDRQGKAERLGHRERPMVIGVVGDLLAGARLGAEEAGLGARLPTDDEESRVGASALQVAENHGRVPEGGAVVEGERHLAPPRERQQVGVWLAEGVHYLGHADLRR